MSIATMRDLTPSFLLFLLELSPLTSFAAASAGLKGLSMGCECGEGEEGRAEEAGRGEDLLLGGDAQVRIVDGYEPKRRPWMVYLQAICFEEKKSFLPHCLLLHENENYISKLFLLTMSARSLPSATAATLACAAARC